MDQQPNELALASGSVVIARGAENSTNNDRGTVSVLHGAHGTRIEGGTWTIAGGNVVTNHTTVQNTTVQYLSGDGNAVSKWLSTMTEVNYQARLIDTLGICEMNTSAWVLEETSFMEWFGNDRRTLFGKGIPGSGKTIIASVVIKYLQDYAKDRSDTVCVIFALCRYSDSCSISSILASFIRQLYERYHPAASAIEDVYRIHQREQTRPPTGELWQILQRVLELFVTSFCVIDGLDELPDRQKVELVSSLRTLKVNLFILSRPLPWIEDTIPQATAIPILAQDADISTLVSQWIQRTPQLAPIIASHDLETHITATIQTKSSGMFLLAKLQLDMLQECQCIEDMTDALATLPSGVNDMYDRTMDRIEQQGHPRGTRAKQALLWILFASRTLSIDELRYALAVSPKTGLFEEGRLVAIEALIASCCGLVTVEEESGCVRLIHYTAQDYLKPVMNAQFPDAHATISAACVTRLRQFEFHDRYFEFEHELNQTYTSHPFLEYCHTNWSTHARQSIPSPTVLQFAHEVQHYPYLRTRTSSSLPKIEHLGPLHFAAQFDVFDPPELRTLISSFDLNTQTDRGSTPLALAAEHGNVRVVETILQLDPSSVNIGNHDAITPLVWASRNGHEAIVKALLAVEGLDLNPKDHREASALICAAESGHNAVVKLLVQRKGISFSPAFSGGPLLLATSAGHLDVVKTLLVIDPSALNMRMSDGQTPLSRAAYRGFDDIVDYLLSFKDSIEINWGDRNNITPLMWAVFANRVSIVKKLIAFDEIDLSPIGRMNGKTALSIAVENGHTEVEELLKERMKTLKPPRKSQHWWIESGELDTQLVLPDFQLGVPTSAYASTVEVKAGSLPDEMRLMSQSLRHRQVPAVDELLHAAKAKREMEAKRLARGWSQSALISLVLVFVLIVTAMLFMYAADLFVVNT